MDSDALQQFAGVIRGLIANTKSGQMVWTKVNPTTFSWADGRGHIILQQVSSSVRVSSGLRREAKGYLFQVLDHGKSPQLVVNSTEMVAATDILRSLHEAVAASFTKKGVDFLRDLISNVDESDEGGGGTE